MLLVVASCAKGTPLNPILPAGVSPTPFPIPEYVGIGKYDGLAEVTEPQWFGGVPFMTFLEISQPRSSEITGLDLPGWVYAYQGPHLVLRQEGERQTLIDAGKAAWVEGEVDHLNATDEDQIWYLIVFRSIAQRKASLTYPKARILYATGDLESAPPGKKLTHQLGVIRMEAGGRTSAHSHGGTESLYVMKGTVQLATNDGKRQQLAAGQGASVNPGVIMQLRVVGDEPVQILTYFVTPEGAAWQTNVQNLP